tara:strand:- start:577 stop:759 length:183 start_codon:yes stop_codon:yes gene_type:complete
LAAHGNERAQDGLARVVDGTAQLGATRPGRAEAIWFYLAVKRTQNPVRVIATGDPKDAFS